MNKLLLSCALLSMSCISSAANWQYYSTDADDIEIYVDADSVKWESTGIKVAWTKALFPNEEYHVVRNLFDCENDKFRILQVHEYNKKGQVLGSLDKPMEWMDNIPGSNMADLSKAVCDYQN